jgi:hypothetical protein
MRDFACEIVLQPANFEREQFPFQPSRTDQFARLRSQTVLRRFNVRDAPSKKEFEPASIDKPFRKSSRACFPACCAAL